MCLCVCEFSSRLFGDIVGFGPFRCFAPFGEVFCYIHFFQCVLSVQPRLFTLGSHNGSKHWSFVPPPFIRGACLSFDREKGRSLVQPLLFLVMSCHVTRRWLSPRAGVVLTSVFQLVSLSPNGDSNSRLCCCNGY